MLSKQKLLPIIALLTGAVVWGLIWYPYRFMEAAGISGALATCITYGIALVSASRCFIASCAHCGADRAAGLS
ncbi:MAG: hypothetical protein ACR2FI_12070 [Burkholderiales bacterium]